MKLTTLLLMFLGALTAQMQDNTQPTLACDSRENSGRQVRHCEMREQTMPYAGQLNVDGKTNGGVSVKGWNRPDVLVRMKVEAGAENEGDARALVSQVRVSTSAGRVAAEGPQTSNNRYWSVSYEVFVPHQANIEAATHNGGVHISDVQGTIRFNATNGGITLARIGGDVQGRTTNGGVTIKLAGARWEGQGLDVSTTNGGVKVELPANYSAQFETSTVNGGLSSDFGDRVQMNKDHQFKTSLGSGGAPIRITTTNGGVKLARI